MFSCLMGLLPLFLLAHLFQGFSRDSGMITHPYKLYDQMHGWNIHLLACVLNLG